MKFLSSLALSTSILFATMTVAHAANVNLPPGSTIDSTLQQDLNSKTAQDGQQFTLVTASGSRIRGHLSNVHRSTITGRKAGLTLNADTITFADGTTSPIDAEIVAVAQHKQTNYLQAAGQVVGGMVVGNVVGKAIGGAASHLGGLVGVAGGALLAANSSSNIDVPAGAQVRMKLNAPLVVRPQAR